MLGRYRLLGQFLFAAGGAALVYLFGGAAVEGHRREERTPIEALGPAYEGVNRLAPNFSLPDRNGHRTELKSLRGKVVVLNFWTITCGPCREEMPSLERFHRIAAEGDDVELLTVTVDENWAAISRMFPRGTNLKILFDPDRSVVEKKFGTRLFPETWIIDRKGIIRARFDGARDWASGLALSLIRSLT